MRQYDLSCLRVVFSLCLLIPKMLCGLDGEIAVAFLWVWVEPSCGIFDSFLASVIGMVFHMLIGYSATIFYRAGKPSDTWSNSWAELASPKLVVYKFSWVPTKFCLSWLRLFISVSDIVPHDVYHTAPW